MGTPINKLSISDMVDRHAVDLLDDALNAISLYGAAWVWCDYTSSKDVAPYVRPGGTREMVCRELSDIVFELLVKMPLDEVAEQTVYVGNASGQQAMGQSKLESK